MVVMKTMLKNKAPFGGQGHGQSSSSGPSASAFAHLVQGGQGGQGGQGQTGKGMRGKGYQVGQLVQQMQHQGGMGQNEGQIVGHLVQELGRAGADDSGAWGKGGKDGAGMGHLMQQQLARTAAAWGMGSGMEQQLGQLLGVGGDDGGSWGKGNSGGSWGKGGDMGQFGGDSWGNGGGVEEQLEQLLDQASGDDLIQLVQLLGGGGCGGGYDGGSWGHGGGEGWQKTQTFKVDKSGGELGEFVGVIKSFGFTKNYGFIECEEAGQGDIFLHGIEKKGFQQGQTVKFTCVLTKEGKPNAINLKSGLK